ncbi:MAG: hypothetical protein K9L59_03785 [Desulfobacterales bacterium]|nr:hypothetical protein [Desulfobacterales bacterium]
MRGHHQTDTSFSDNINFYDPSDDIDIGELGKRLLDEADAKFECRTPYASLEEAIAESEKAYSEKPLYDFGLGKKSNHQAVMDFYGYELYHRILDELEESYDCPPEKREQGHISKELWKELRDIRAGRKPYPNQKAEAQKPASKAAGNTSNANPPEIKQRQRQPGDDYRLETERGLVRNHSYRKLFKGPGLVYEVIWSNLVRKGWRDTEEYPIRKKYHDERKLLVYCTSYRKLADECGGMSHHTVKKFLDSFEEAGILKTEIFKPKGPHPSQIVIILGYWTGNGKKYREHFYRDEIFLSPKVGKN